MADVLNIDGVLGKAKNRIAQVGIEFEGGWKNLPRGAELIRDGSIHIDELVPRNALERQTFKIGELVSPPMAVEDMPAWVKKYYPSDFNVSCGLHIHMSFKLAHHYQKLMDARYQDTVVEYLKRFAREEGLKTDHPIWPRLEGRSEYCQLLFEPDIQVQARQKNYDRNFKGHRYTFINYCHGLHSTIECRGLPMLETSALATRALQRIIDITNGCLSKLGQREERFRVEVIDEPGAVPEIVEMRF